MGYDLHTCKPDQDVLDKVEAAKKRFDTAVVERDTYARLKGWDRGVSPTDDPTYSMLQADVSKAYDELNPVETYFRLNIWGMGRMRETMNKLDALITDYSMETMPAWPDFETFGITEEQWDEAYDLGDDELKPEVLKFRLAERAVRAWSPSDAPGIPVHKLCDNSGWIVSEVECASAAGLMRMHPDFEAERAAWAEDRAESYLDDWLRFLDYASTHGGFEVN